MYYTDKQELTDQLNQAIEKAQTAFEPGFTNKLMRLVKNPKNVILRKLLVGVFKQKYRLTMKAKMFYGEPYYLDNLEYDTWFSGTTLAEPELELTRFLINVLKEDDVFFDIGAHYGFFSVLASDMGAQVHTFEASYANFVILEKSARTRSNIVANNVAVHEKTGTITFYDGSSQDSTTTPELVGYVSRDMKEIQMPSVSLDDYCKEHGVWPTVIKIDIEGAEKDAIVGAPELFKNHAPIIVMELLPTERYKDNLKASDLLLEMGYKPYRIQPNGSVRALTSVVPPIETHELHQNLVFKKD